MRQQVGEHVERSRLEVLHSPVEADLAGRDVDGAVAETDHSREFRVAERPGHPSANPQATTKRPADADASNRRMPTNQTPTLSTDPSVVEPPDAPASLDTRLFEAAIGSLEMLSVHLGRRLGLYDAIGDAGEVTVDDLATRAAIAPRYAREWLEQQAVAGFVTVDDPDADAAIRRFRLSDEQQAVFVEPDHPAHVSPVADMIAGIGGALDDVADAYRRGTGVAYKDYGPHLRHGQGGINRPAYTTALADWLDATEIGPRLRDAGPAARIADVGCGQGWSTIALAAMYPQADIVGFDDDTASIDDARLHAAAAGVDVTFEALPATAVADHGPFDAVDRPRDAARHRPARRRTVGLAPGARPGRRRRPRRREGRRHLHRARRRDGTVHVRLQRPPLPPVVDGGARLRRPRHRPASGHRARAHRRGGLRAVRRDRRRRRVLPHLRAHPVSTHTRPPTRPTRSTP